MSAREVCEAVVRGDLDTVRQMIKANPSLKEEPYRGRTPLHWAAYHGQVHIAWYLVDQGADKDKANVYGWTPTYWAANNGHLDVVRYLVEQTRADKDKVDVDGWTPLMAAACYGHLDVVRCLLEEDANVTLKCRRGRTALAIAEQHRHAEVADALRDYLPGGLMYQRRDAVVDAVLNQKDLGPDVARFCGEFIKIT